MNGIIGMTELTLDSDINRSQRESLLLVHSLARSLLCVEQVVTSFLRRDVLSCWTSLPTYGHSFSPQMCIEILFIHLYG